MNAKSLTDLEFDNYDRAELLEQEGIGSEDQQRLSSMLSDTADTFLRWAVAMQEDVARQYISESYSHDDLVLSCKDAIAKVVGVFHQFKRLVGSSLSQAVSDQIHQNLACFRNLIQVEQILCNALTFAQLRCRSFPAHPAQPDIESAPEELRLAQVVVEQCAQYLERRLVKIRTRLQETDGVIYRVATNGDVHHFTRLQILFLEMEEKIRLVALDSGECEQKMDETNQRIRLTCGDIRLWTPQIIALEVVTAVFSFSFGIALRNFFNLSSRSPFLVGVLTFVAASAYILNSKKKCFSFKNQFNDHMKNRDYRAFQI